MEFFKINSSEKVGLNFIFSFFSINSMKNI